SLITYHLPPKRPLRLCPRKKRSIFLDRINRTTYHLLLITYHLPPKRPCASAREKNGGLFLTGLTGLLITYYLLPILLPITPPKRPLRLCARKKRRLIFDRINRITYYLLLITYHLPKRPLRLCARKKAEGFLAPHKVNIFLLTTRNPLISKGFPECGRPKNSLLTNG
ncbi:MAG: hypothetical protein FWG50_11405, partial [Kiritimatiellaeota bacterium]|nr:hypothetical protein [Kiritimatiellota bacterium]